MFLKVTFEENHATKPSVVGEEKEEGEKGRGAELYSDEKVV